MTDSVHGSTSSTHSSSRPYSSTAGGGSTSGGGGSTSGGGGVHTELPASITIGMIMKARRSVINMCDLYGRTPLLLASALGHRELLGCLLGNGGDISVGTPEGHNVFTVGNHCFPLSIQPLHYHLSLAIHTYTYATTSLSNTHPSHLHNSSQQLTTSTLIYPFFTKAKNASIGTILEKPLLRWLSKREHVKGSRVGGASVCVPLIALLHLTPAIMLFFIAYCNVL